MNRAIADGFARLPAFRCANEQAAIRAAPQRAAAGAKQAAREVALSVFGDRFDAQTVWVIAANATVCAEPDDAFASNEDRVDAIRAQAACRALKSEAFNFTSVAEPCPALPISSYPEVAATVEAERRHRAQPGADFFGMQQIAAAIQAAVFGSRL